MPEFYVADRQLSAARLRRADLPQVEWRLKKMPTRVRRRSLGSVSWRKSPLAMVRWARASNVARMRSREPMMRREDPPRTVSIAGTISIAGERGDVASFGRGLLQ